MTAAPDAEAPCTLTDAETIHLSRYDDVTRALRDPRLVLPGQGGADPSAHLAVRAAAEQALSPQCLNDWRARFAEQARALVDALPDGEPVDLMAALARPWSLQLALQVTGAPPDGAAEGERQARRLFLAAAVATDGSLQPAAMQAAAALAPWLARGAHGGQPGGVADVQTFVALSQSLPALLAGAWLALLCHPAALDTLLEAPDALPGAVGELLRLGSPARAVFRQATADLDLGGTRLRAGQTVALLLHQANRDPARFADPERLDLGRDTHAHLAFGTGVHACAGAALVRLAVAIASQALLAGCRSLQRVDEAESAQAWLGGFALRAPAALWVRRQARR